MHRVYNNSIIHLQKKFGYICTCVHICTSQHWWATVLSGKLEW